MKSYLGLVWKYAKAHKKKNRLIVICITISVMLVTAIFGMADMSLKAQMKETIRRYGDWHINITGISDGTADEIRNRNDIAVSGWLGRMNAVTYQDKALVIQSSSQKLAEQMNLVVNEGRYPISEGEAILDADGLMQFKLSIGDVMEVSLPNGQMRSYKITGTFRAFSSLKGDDAHGLQLTTEGMRDLPADLYQKYYYVQFAKGVNIQKAIANIKTEYSLSEEQIHTNVMLLGLMGQSNDTTMKEVYLTAISLFILVAMAGTFMIASSFNMGIRERTQFFGMLRCLGATQKQIKRYIRLEGLQYCMKAIPLGLGSGCVILWGVIFVLNTLNSKYLPMMPMFQISLPGIGAGILIGFLVVMVASNSPAKKAARVSPQAAVTGNLTQTNIPQNDNKASNTSWFRVDTAMGLRHAISNKKSMGLIAGSFAISIILFLCFTILVAFMNHALSPLKPFAPDLTLEGKNASILLPTSLKNKAAQIPGVDKVYGRMLYPDIPAKDKMGTNMATLVSYDNVQFDWAKNALISGSVQAVQNGKGVLVDYANSEKFGWKMGDTITLKIAGVAHEVQVAGIVSDAPMDASKEECIIVCSEQTFMALTGVDQYQVIDLQIHKDVSNQVRSIINPEIKLLDFQKNNREVRAGYLAMAVFVYSFLLVIALVALINIGNTVYSSVSSRMHNYGVMRAVGMSNSQLKKVIRAEAMTYAVIGCLTGSILGLLLHQFFFEQLITSTWGQPWSPPIVVLLIIDMTALITTMIAAIFPVKMIKKARTINLVNIVNCD